jgi:cytochrome c oxidase assembly factor CtaG
MGRHLLRGIPVEIRVSMTTGKLLMSMWDFEPSVIAGSVLLLAGYLAAVRFRFDRRTILFLCGVAVMFFALVSPLDGLGDTYLFSAHMLQHILLDLVAPPLFILGLPEGLARRIVSWRPAGAAERFLGRLPVAWTLGIGTLWIWHLPALYDATLESEAVHIFEHLTFLVTGTILWWPVLTPLRERRMPPLFSMGYLSLAAVANAVLGIIFTISSTPFYAPYAHPEDPLGALPLIRGVWGLDPIQDQQLGGAFMWGIGSLVFFSGIMGQVIRWFGEPESEEEFHTGGEKSKAGDAT